MDLSSRYHRENIRKKTLHDFQPHLLLALARQFRFERSHPLRQVLILFLVEHMLDLMVSGRVSLRCQLIRGTSEVKQSLVEFVRRERLGRQRLVALYLRCGGFLRSGQF